MFDRLTSAIQKYNYILIYRHQKPDGDALGAQFGLKHFIELNFKNKIVYTMGEDYSDYLSWLQIKYDNKIPENTKYLAIIVDTANINRIDGKNWNNADTIIKIDHHVSGEDFGDIKIINHNLTSTCELLSNYYFSSTRFKLNSEISKYTYLGIVTDSGRFRYPSTTHKTHEMVSKLLKYDFDTKFLYSNLYSKPKEIIKFNSYILSKIKFYDNIVWVILPKNIEKKI